MNLYAIRRENGWKTPDEIEAVAKRAIEVADTDFPGEIRWIRSYVVAEAGGSLGSICIYQANDPDAVRKHAERVGMPADEVLDLADTVIVRPDPEQSTTDPQKAS